MKKQSRKRGRYGDGCVYRNGRLWWLAWYERRTDGRLERRYKSSGSDDKKVAQRMLRTELQRMGGRRPTVTDPGKVLYDDLRENFLAHCAAKNLRSLKRDKSGQVTLATLPRLDGYFSRWRAAEITVADLKRFRAEGKAEDLSDARLNRYMATLRAMFRQGAKDELITATELPAYFPTVGEPNVARGALYVQREWYAPLRKALKEPLRSAFVMAYGTGIRVGELQRLRWRDIDTDKRIVTLPAEITKTGRARVIPLPRDFGLKPGPPDALVFTLGEYRWRWYKACVKIGAGRWEETDSGRKRYVGILLRHCRHTFVRDASDAGLEEKRIMETTGHVTRSMFDRYNIGRDEDVARVRETMERFRRL